MSVSFCWEVVKASKTFRSGTSTDSNTLREVFPTMELSIHNIPTLRAMHLAAGYKTSLWEEIADTLEKFPAGSKIRIWEEF